MNISEVIRQAQQAPNNEGKSLLISMARLLASQGLNQTNTDSFLEFLATGYSEIADVFFAHRQPSSFFRLSKLMWE